MLNNQPKLLQDLGCLEINSIRKDTGKVARKRFGIFECPSCKKSFKALFTAVKNKRTIQCYECGIKEISKKITIHGKTKTRLYGIYSGIKSRVYNKNRKCSKNYSLRGISMCNEWKQSPQAFIDWAENNGYKDDLTIDRIDNDGDYKPSNCRWVNMVTQAQNKRPISSANTSGYKGVTKVSRQNKWATRISVNKKNIYIGVFDSAIDAGYAYDKFVLQNNLNHSTNGLLQIK